MPPTATNVLHGISEVGEVTDPYGTPTDVPWGATEQDGVVLRISGNQVDVRSGQSLVLEDRFLSGLDITAEVTLQYTDLLNVARGMGLADSEVTGDLQAGTPVAEVLNPLQTAIGNREFYFYILTPGPTSTRRIELKRCKINPDFQLAFASSDYQKIRLQLIVLAPRDASDLGRPIRITDAP